MSGTVATSTAAANSQVTPDLIFQTAAGFMAGKMLFVATEIGLFEKLAAGPATAEELAARLSIPVRTTRIVADAMVALGFLERQGDRYVNAPVAAQFLAGSVRAADMRPFARFWNRISYPRWQTLEQAVRAGQGVLGMLKFSDAEEQRIFSEGVEGFSQPAARALPTAYDFSTHKRVLDLGGGTGNFLIALAEQYPHLGLTLYELPAAAAVARRCLKDSPHSARIEVVEGDFLRDPIPAGHDVVIMANVVHTLSPELNRTLLRRTRDCVGAGARVLMVDLWLNAERNQPLMGALMSGEFLIMTGDGQSYSEGDGSAMLADSGWHALECLPVAGPARVLIGAAA